MTLVPGEKTLRIKNRLLPPYIPSAGDTVPLLKLGNKRVILPTGALAAGDQVLSLKVGNKRYLIPYETEAGQGIWSTMEAYYKRYFHGFWQEGPEIFFTGGGHCTLPSYFTSQSVVYSSDYGKTWAHYWHNNAEVPLLAGREGFGFYYDSTTLDLWMLGGKHPSYSGNYNSVYKILNKGAGAYQYLGNFNHNGVAFASWKVLGDTIYQISGRPSATTYTKEVWSCPIDEDFLTWTQLDDVPWTLGRSLHENTIVWGGKIWVFGGTNSSGQTKDLWSFNGTDWTLELDDDEVPWPLLNYGCSIGTARISGTECIIALVYGDGTNKLLSPRLYYSKDMYSWGLMNEIPVQFPGGVSDPIWYVAGYRTLARGPNGRLLIFLGWSQPGYLTENFCYRYNYYVKTFPPAP